MPHSIGAWKGSSSGGGCGLQSRKGLRDSLWWVRHPLPSANFAKNYLSINILIAYCQILCVAYISSKLMCFDLFIHEIVLAKIIGS